MIRKILKGLGIFIGIAVALLAGFYIKAYISTENRFAKKYDITLQTLEIKPDSALLAEGQRLIAAKGCKDCHGQDLSGRIFIDDPALGQVVAVNLTKGKGGLPADYNEQDWLKALQHGLNRNNTTLKVMPSYEYTHFSEEDMKAIIAYGMQLPAIDNELPQTHFKPVGRILADLNKLPVMVAEMIDHSKSLSTDVVPEVSIKFGKYLSVSCTACHKENMQGGDPVVPGSPQVANISSSGNVGKWTEEQFMTTLRSGVTPEGKILPAQFMPWTMTKDYTDTELKALYLYLRSI